MVKPQARAQGHQRESCRARGARSVGECTIRRFLSLATEPRGSCDPVPVIARTTNRTECHTHSLQPRSRDREKHISIPFGPARAPLRCLGARYCTLHKHIFRCWLPLPAPGWSHASDPEAIAGLAPPGVFAHANRPCVSLGTRVHTRDDAPHWSLSLHTAWWHTPPTTPRPSDSGRDLACSAECTR